MSTSSLSPSRVVVATMLLVVALRSSPCSCLLMLRFVAVVNVMLPPSVLSALPSSPPRFAGGSQSTEGVVTLVVRRADGDEEV
ncbi:hypothetical protein BVRB_8g201890 [Beta vulgaris subsp. vulgaris]|uniref:Uncharacterized protein n=1 Tax=Beta vulgaris subsp. vulgaris TaxID=3555 RepID=A0A0J8B9A9_BETVV|nr:hypothetical protein BVRB_8g201890 [Beta vulgaris subsp. vulgaris]